MLKNKLGMELVWRGYTNTKKMVMVVKHPNETGKWRYEVNAGRLYPATFYKTKKAAMKWASEVLMTFNDYSAGKGVLR